MDDLIQYLSGLNDEERRTAVAALPLDQRLLLIQAVCRKVGELAEAFVKNADEIWESRHDVAADDAR